MTISVFLSAKRYFQLVMMSNSRTRLASSLVENIFRTPRTHSNATVLTHFQGHFLDFEIVLNLQKCILISRNHGRMQSTVYWGLNFSLEIERSIFDNRGSTGEMRIFLYVPWALDLYRWLSAEVDWVYRVDLVFRRRTFVKAFLFPHCRLSL